MWEFISNLTIQGKIVGAIWIIIIFIGVPYMFWFLSVPGKKKDTKDDNNENGEHTSDSENENL